MIRLPAFTICALLAAPGAIAQGFDVTVLGATGGIQDGNLSAFMIAPHGDPRAVTCDAGALVSGLIAAETSGSLDAIAVPDGSDYTRIGHTLTEVIKGYMISHAHLDHIAGLVAASPDDSSKPIYGLASVQENIARTYFNWIAWPNFGTVGTMPQLGKYPATTLEPGNPVPVTGTGMEVTAFPLMHGGPESTAFLLQSGGDAILCLGDTGPDSVNGSDALADVWAAVADLARDGALKGIIIESSYTSDRPDDLLFGHLTPKYVLEELGVLAGLAGENSLQGMPVIISHVKYSLKTGTQPQQQVLEELQAMDTLGLRFIMPEQGALYRMGAQ